MDREGGMNLTNDPLRSWVPVPADSDFPIQNLPYGIFRRDGGTPHAGVAIGEHVLDLAVVETHGLFNGPVLRQVKVFNSATLNAVLALGRPAWGEARATISQLLRHDAGTLRDNVSLRERALVPRKDVVMLLPVDIGDYTDFYSSRE